MRIAGTNGGGGSGEHPGSDYRVSASAIGASDASDHRGSGGRGSCLMAALPSVSGERAVRAFQMAGWVKDRQHGSHVILVKPGNPASLSVPLHRELAPGTLRSLIRALGMTVMQFANLL